MMYYSLCIKSTIILHTADVTNPCNGSYPFIFNRLSLSILYFLFPVVNMEKSPSVKGLPPGKVNLPCHFLNHAYLTT